MATRNTLSTRWVTVIMVVALLCSVVVVWGLIQITGQSPASSSTPSASPPASDSGRPTGPSGSSDTRTAVPPSATADSADPRVADGSRSRGTDLPTAVTTIAPALPGTGLPLPAAWTGTAE